MKVLYSELKKYIPSLTAEAKAVGQTLTFNGFLQDSFEPVKHEGKSDFVLGLEVRQNRPDCLSVFGLAREVAAAYGKKVVLPQFQPEETKPARDLFSVKAKSGVRAVLVKKYVGLKNGPSPKWLRDFLEHSGMRSVSLLVDASNYVMLQTGYPSHVFDGRKLVGRLLWDKAKRGETFTTLDGTVLELVSGELVVRDSGRVVALAGVVGGQHTAVSTSTQTAVVEMALYDPELVRQSAGHHGLRTEASMRLGKTLPAGSMEQAFAWLCQIIEKEVKSPSWSAPERFGNFSDRAKTVVYDPTLASKLAGVAIPENKSRMYLERLGFGVKGKNKFLVTVPVFRSDVGLDVDVAEEIIRLHDFRSIPVTSPKFSQVSDMTAPSIVLSRRASEILEVMGYDEIRTLPFTTEQESARFANSENLTPIVTQNSVNEELPSLRTSLLPGLVAAASSMARKGQRQIQLFELGKVFWKQGRKFLEADKLACVAVATVDLSAFVYDAQRLLGTLGANEVSFQKITGKSSAGFNPHGTWQVRCFGKPVGLLAQLSPLHVSGTQTLKQSFAFELDLPELLAVLGKNRASAAQEVLEKLVTLDTNVLAGRELTASEVLLENRDKIPAKNLWSMEVVDSFNFETQVKYTLRVTYIGLDDIAAKKLHSKLFS